MFLPKLLQFPVRQEDAVAVMADVHRLSLHLLVSVPFPSQHLSVHTLLELCLILLAILSL